MFCWQGGGMRAGNSRGRGNMCRARRFRPKPGDTLRWSNTCLAEGERSWALRDVWKKYPKKRVIQTGTVTVDEHGLVTLKGVTIVPTKNRIVISK